ncbi:unnamed protein product [Lymnaea stagnalis]|uniref:Uncharacterized protein n=1 Tax=Lymnaea stagnalis TaxID=6523 RepID=A0AAV2HKP6_LYMST
MNQLRSWLYGHESHKLENSNDKPLLSVEDIQTAKTDSILRKTLLRFIPLAPGDCLECKLVGTGVMMLSGLIVLTSALQSRKSNPKVIVRNGALYYTLCGGLFLGKHRLI